MPMKSPFYRDKPLMVKIPFTTAGKLWQRGEVFNWVERGFKEIKVTMLYKQNYLYHVEEADLPEVSVGDGLDDMNVGELHELVKSLNVKVKEGTKNKAEFDKKKCKFSKVLDKQRGIIRSWRSNFGDFEV